MANLIDSTKYLDLAGLGIYDNLIKGVITAGDQANADALDALTTTVTNELTELDERVDNNTSGISSLNTRVESLETSTSDWNENDPTSPSYIKNRTHYEEGGPGVVYGEIEGTESQIHFYISYYSTDYTTAQYGLVAGKRYHVTIYREGMERIAGYYTAESYPNGTVALSNAGYTTYPQSGNSMVPVDWGVRCLSSSNNIRFDSMNDYGTVHVIVSDNDPEGGTIKTLDEKFIPATIARTADVDLGVLKTGGVTYDTGTNKFGYGGTSGGGYVNKINLNSGYITGLTGIYSLFGAPINISEVKKLTFYTGGSIENVYNINMDGNLTGVCNIGFAGGTTLVRKKARGTSGSIPVVTFEETTTGTRTMTLGKDNALSITDYYSGDYPDRPYGTPEVKISGTLNVSGKIYAGNTYNTISGNSGGMDIMTSGATNCYVGINGVKINTSGSISEVATLSFKSGGTLTPSVIGVQEIFGKNNVHISMSGSTTGDGIDFGNAPLKNINGITMHSGGKITGANLSGNGHNSISGYNNITMAYSGTLDMNNSSINNANTINIDSGTLNVIGGVINASGALLKMSNTSITGNIDATNAHINGASGAVNIGFSGTGISGKLDMISGILETSGVEIRSGGTVSISSGTLYMDYGTILAIGTTLSANIDASEAYINGGTMEDVTITSPTIDGGTIGYAAINSSTIDSCDITGTINATGATIYDATLCCNISGYKFNYISGMTYKSGNTFTSGFINELKAALGIS